MNKHKESLRPHSQNKCIFFTNFSDSKYSVRGSISVPSGSWNQAGRNSATILFRWVDFLTVCRVDMARREMLQMRRGQRKQVMATLRPGGVCQRLLDAVVTGANLSREAAWRPQWSRVEGEFISLAGGNFLCRTGRDGDKIPNLGLCLPPQEFFLSRTSLQWCYCNC